ncbi:MAG: hypothetical protein VX601_09900 [Pseudomonadota bacterium]|nr:hypothetical protein [Pseudomonadota bacterium]
MKEKSPQAAWKGELLFIISVCTAAKAFARHLEICPRTLDLQARVETFEASARCAVWPSQGRKRAK